MKLKVLATSWHPGAINAIVPVIKKLHHDGLTEIVTIGHQYSEPILDANGIRYKKINNYGLSDVSLKSMESLLKQESPDLVLTGTSVQDEKNRDVIEQTITLAGRRKDIFTVAVLDSWANYSLRFNDIYSGENFRFLPDKIAIMDQYAEMDMLAEGFDKNRLVITGNPHFDNLEAKARFFTEEEKRKLRQQIGLGADILFFYAANASKKLKLGYWDLDNIRLVNEVLRELPQQERQKYGLIAKLHPRVPKEELDQIREYISTESDGRIRLLSEIPPQDLILASNLTLTPSSTLGIEAAYMAKPCISLQPNLQGEDYLAVLTKNRIVPVGYTSEDCKALVKKALDEEFREHLVQQASSFRNDGKATERVVGLIYQLL